jgi:hypothetical protein
MLDKPIGEDGLTARDITRVNVKLPEGREQLMSLQDAAEATGEVQAAVRDALDIHESTLRGALLQAEEFHAATTGIVEEYEAFLKAHRMKLPKRSSTSKSTSKSNASLPALKKTSCMIVSAKSPKMRCVMAA